MTPETLEIRKPTLVDCPSWGAAHCQCWQETYPGLVPPEFLKEFSPEKSASRFLSAIDSSLIAVEQGKVVGFVVYSLVASACVSSHPASEIRALYVLRSHQRRGLGGALIKKAIALLPEKDVFLYVLKGNANAIAFYEKIGFAFTGNGMVRHVSGGLLDELEMVFHRP